MTATQIIGEIENLEAAEQDKVIRFAVSFAANRKLTGEQLHTLAAGLPGMTEAEADALKQELERGFYGGRGDA